LGKGGRRSKIFQNEKDPKIYQKKKLARKVFANIVRLKKYIPFLTIPPTPT
jgi:hypothetical protein